MVMDWAALKPKRRVNLPSPARGSGPRTHRPGRAASWSNSPLRFTCAPFTITAPIPESGRGGLLPVHDGRDLRHDALAWVNPSSLSVRRCSCALGSVSASTTSK